MDLNLHRADYFQVNPKGRDGRCVGWPGSRRRCGRSSQRRWSLGWGQSSRTWKDSSASRPDATPHPSSLSPSPERLLLLPVNRAPPATPQSAQPRPRTLNPVRIRGVGPVGVRTQGLGGGVAMETAGGPSGPAPALGSLRRPRRVQRSAPCLLRPQPGSVLVRPPPKCQLRRPRFLHLHHPRLLGPRKQPPKRAPGPRPHLRPAGPSRPWLHLCLQVQIRIHSFKLDHRSLACRITVSIRSIGPFFPGRLFRPATVPRG